MSSEFRVSPDIYSSFGTNTSSDIADFAAPIVKWKGWIRLIATVQITLSVLYVVFFLVIVLRGIGVFGIGLLVALLPIYSSVLMLQTVTAAKQAHTRGDASSLMKVLSKVKTCFVIQAVVIVAGFVLAIAYTLAVARLVLAMHALHQLPH
ncbi:MAG TPA: hypothetical protein VNE18_12450 [Rhodanobacter sp.]|nr:hypothetical protein [Rhodanobacter sp.]